MDMRTANPSFLLVFVCICGASAEAHEGRLLSHLLRDINPLVRPAQSRNTTTNVQFGISLIQADIDDLGPVPLLVAKIWLKFLWTDEFLRWDQQQYDGINMVHVLPEQIWTPDIKLYNSHDVGMEMDSVKALVMSDGTVMWIPPAKVRVRCPNFGDLWHCALKFGSWTYNGEELDVNFFDDLEDIDVTDYIPSNQWDLEETRGVKNTKFYPCCPEPYPDLTFSLTMRRY